MLSFYDLLLTPIYFLMLSLWVVRWRNKHYKNSPLKKYVLPAFIIKSVCCILLAFLYEYYYGAGDPFNYYRGSLEIWNATKANPIYGLELIFKPLEDCSFAAKEFTDQMSDSQFSASVINMYKIGGFVSIFCFGTYLPMALIFTFLSFIGSWKIFIVFTTEFPAYYKKAALTCLFAPSFVFWSTNILKDPLCIFGLGLCFSALYNLMKGKFNFSILLSLIAGSFFMLVFKSYIFYIFCLAGFSALYIHFITNLKLHYKVLVKFLMFIVFCTAALIAVKKRDTLGEIFFSEIFNSVSAVQGYQKEAGGSVYVLSNVEDGSLLGIIKTYLSSLNVSLFRPYLWEVSSLVVVANALESFAVFLLTFYLIVKLKAIGFFKYAFQNRVLNFAFIFTLLLAPLAGLVSFNFGTLVRYKTPIVPFYYTYIMILYYKTKEKKNIIKNPTDPILTSQNQTES